MRVTPYIKTGYANSNVFVPFLKVSGINGTLTGLAVCSGSSYHFVRISIDGRQIVEDFLCGSFSTLENNGIGVNLPFESELFVEVKDSNPTTLARFWASYVVSSSRVIEEKYFPEKIGDKSYIYKSTTLETPEGKKYRVDSLIGCERISKVSLTQDTFLKGEPISGHVTLQSWDGKELEEHHVTLNVRPIGRTRIIQTFEIGSVRGTKEFKESLKYEIVGTFEIATDLKGYANIPAILTIL